VASALGRLQRDGVRLSFAVVTRDVPDGDAVVVGTTEDLRPVLPDRSWPEPSVELVPHPSTPGARLLVVVAPDGAGLEAAASSLAARDVLPEAPRLVAHPHDPLPAARAPDEHVHRRAAGHGPRPKAHARPMPDLAAFVHEGYPFTRHADLADTAIVLGERPTNDELAWVLSFLAHAARVTGIGGVRVALTTPRALLASSALSRRDLLVAGAAPELFDLAQWTGSSPLDLSRSPPRVPALPDGPLTALLAPERALTERIHATASLGAALSPVVLVAFESPLAEGRSVVALVAAEGARRPQLAALTRPTEGRVARGDVLLARCSRSAVNTCRRARRRVCSSARSGGSHTTGSCCCRCSCSARRSRRSPRAACWPAARPSASRRGRCRRDHDARRRADARARPGRPCPEGQVGERKGRVA
ncbi:cellulose biosynthesis cyclic di-GMP-binding regulatory protein BcsB, partial [Myxococcota bacterium]|nr:cellulose biosynthesis cyclic di-GMP-binding regulatory protein BcsB [Myxococcota bacterium]